MKISKRKECELLERAYLSLGWHYPDVKNISDLDLWEAENKENILKINEILETSNLLLEQLNRSLEEIDELRNEYEKEILRYLNPNLTIY